jgi:hypothetical protein
MRVTIIEKVVIMIIGIIVFMMAFNVYNGVSGNNTISFGINGMTEMRCIDGYRFIVGEHGQVRQVMDEFGKGLKCN